MTRAPWQKEAAERLQRWEPKNQAWKEREFQRINEILTETGLIPRMHELFVARGVEETWAVLDCFEMTYGFPVPGVFTRYLLPSESEEDKEVLDWNAGEMLPGLFISEILGFGGRTVLIQFGIDNHDRERISTRMGLFLKQPEQGVSEGGVPDWWKYDYDVADFTAKYDLVQDPEEKLRFANVSEEQDYYLRSWIYGRPRPKTSILEFEYEKEDDGPPEYLWIGEGQQLDEAFHAQATILDQMAKKP